MPLFLYFVISHLFASFILPENSFSPGSMLGTAALWFSSLMDVTKFGYLVGSLAALDVGSLAALDDRCGFKTTAC